MLTDLRIQNFKSWADTGPMRFAPITGLFGANSSGKTSILQLLLMLKQTVESTDRSRVLNLGDERSLVNLGTFSDIIHAHRLDNSISFSLNWTSDAIERIIYNSLGSQSQSLQFEASVQGKPLTVGGVSRATLAEFRYQVGEVVFGIRQNPDAAPYDLDPAPYEIFYSKPPLGSLPPVHLRPFPAPFRFYGFPDGAFHTFHSSNDRGWLQLFPLINYLAPAVESLFNGMTYLGPLRDYPRPIYTWSGDVPQGVGQRGELAISALLASSTNQVKEPVARWLKDMGLIYDFSLAPLAEHRQEYEVKVKKTAHSAEVRLTDVGFGVSQVLPVLVLCYFVPEGSILILEQPEIHLHPSVQSALADVLIEVAQTRHVQIILESHSEHLLRRLQLRMAEGRFDAGQAALYFCKNEDGTSQLTPLQLDTYGNIANWPDDFFGDEMGELTDMALAAIKRQKQAKR